MEDNIKQEQTMMEPEELPVIIDAKTADEFDGRCFLDLDMFPERIDAIRFEKTAKGIKQITVGCDCVWGYKHEFEDEFGEYKMKDTYFGAEILMVREGNNLLKEITPADFERVVRIVNVQMEKREKLEKEFRDIQKTLDFYPSTDK